ncbi:MAG: hypothetical protein FAF03_08600 [Epsilonproteobacteria bacterium]|nr:hypothetical protein [Campylobacterota bacterium]
MYGLTKKNKIQVLDKIEKQKDFLYSHYIEVQGEKVQLASFFKNTFINADRYIAELQHRVWSLVEYAQNKELVNVFLTLTLPSEYHPKKTLRNGKGNEKLIDNPKYAHKNIILYDIKTKEKATEYEKMLFKYYKTTKSTRYTGKTKTVSLSPKDYEPKKASKELTKMFEVIRKDRSYQELEKDERVYFRVTEPHKDGTPHLHISLWIPKERVARFVQAVHRLYPAPMADIASTYIPTDYKLYKNVYRKWDKETNRFKWFDGYKIHADDKSYIKLQINDSIAYLMKYIYKTLDDLRDNKGITEITMWYILHGICRFYTSRTLISLNVYRPLGGRLSLLELTQHYQDDTVTVFLDPETKQPKIIQYNDVMIWNKKEFELKQYDKDDKKSQGTMSIRTVDIEIDGEEYYMFRAGTKLHHVDTYDGEFESDKEYITPVTQMKMVQLWNYYHSLDIDDPALNLKHFGLVQNTMIERGLISDIEVQPLDIFNTSFGDTYIPNIPDDEIFNPYNRAGY